jgi:hypothetical protein
MENTMSQPTHRRYTSHDLLVDGITAAAAAVIAALLIVAGWGI